MWNVMESNYYREIFSFFALVTTQSAALSSVIQHEMLLDSRIRRNVEKGSVLLRTECLSTRYRQPNLLYVECSVKLEKRVNEKI